MKKNLAFLLAIVLVLTSMVGLTAVADGNEAVVPSQEVEYFNVSLKVGASLLFAVPADGYTVNPDGTVDNLQLLVFEESTVAGVFNVADAIKNGAVLEASGLYNIGGKDYIIFSYDDLAANQMTESVYVRTLVTNEKGYRTYGSIYTYSVAAFASRYKGTQSNLVSSLLAYGDAALAYTPNSNIKANFSATESQNGLYKVTVNMVLNGEPVGSVISQYAKAGEVTLAVPHIDGATFDSWGAGVTDGKVTVSGDTVVTANYVTKADFANYNFEEYVDGDKTYNVAGTYVATDYSGNPTNNDISASAVAPAAPGGSTSWKIGASLNLGNNWYATTNSKGQAVTPHAYCYAKIEIVKDGDNQVMRFAHNGNGQTAFGSFVTTNIATTTGIGDTNNFTIELDVKPAADGTFPYTVLRVDRQGSATSATANGSPAFVKFNHDGSITLGGNAIQYGDLNTNVIVSKASATEYTKISVYVDFQNGLYFGYANGELVAVSEFPVELVPEYYLGGMDALVGTRFQVAMYGGYSASNWSTYGFPKALVDAGHFVFTESEGGTYVYDAEAGVYRNYGSKIGDDVTYAEAPRYKLSYTAGEALQAAVSEHFKTADHFFYDNVRIGYGLSVTK